MRSLQPLLPSCVLRAARQSQNEHKMSSKRDRDIYKVPENSRQICRPSQAKKHRAIKDKAAAITRAV